MTTQRGYRIRLTGFIPCDPKDLSAVRKAIDYADELQKLAGAPKDTVLETFTCSPGRLEITPSSEPEIHTIERAGPPTPKDETTPQQDASGEFQIPPFLQRKKA